MKRFVQDHRNIHGVAARIWDHESAGPIMRRGAMRELMVPKRRDGITMSAILLQHVRYIVRQWYGNVLSHLGFRMDELVIAGQG